MDNQPEKCQKCGDGIDWDYDENGQLLGICPSCHEQIIEDKNK